MTYFTSWDANLFLCLVELGLPADVVAMTVKMARKTHEEYSLDEARSYWIGNSPILVNMGLSARPSPFPRFKFCVPNDNDRGRGRMNVWKNRRNNTIEFKREWRLRSIELRKAKVIEWCKFGSDVDQERHQRRLQNSAWGYNYTDNLWRSWEPWSHCEHPPMIMNWGAVRPQEQDRRNYISQWYEGIHSGRFFLFYKKNKIIEVRNRDLPKGTCEDGYNYPKTPIFDWGPCEQLIEDLRCIDGPGLGESGSHIEHIDDLFLD